jgi:anti-sigma factor RsiW
MNELNPLPPCPEFEHDLAELLDGSLPAARAREVHAHLESCARCRGWQHAYARTDARLAAAFPHASLSPDFSARLMARIAAERPRAPASALRAAATGEYELMRKSLLRGARLRVLVGVLALLATVAAAVLLAPLLAAESSRLLGSLSVDQRLHVFWWCGGAITLASLAGSALQGALPGANFRA